MEFTNTNTENTADHDASNDDVHTDEHVTDDDAIVAELHTEVSDRDEIYSDVSQSEIDDVRIEMDHSHSDEDTAHFDVQAETEEVGAPASVEEEHRIHFSGLGYAVAFVCLICAGFLGYKLKNQNAVHMQDTVQIQVAEQEIENLQHQIAVQKSDEKSEDEIMIVALQDMAYSEIELGNLENAEGIISLVEMMGADESEVTLLWETIADARGESETLYGAADEVDEELEKWESLIDDISLPE